jgi:hypothetical protein
MSESKIMMIADSKRPQLVWQLCHWAGTKNSIHSQWLSILRDFLRIQDLTDINLASHEDIEGVLVWILYEPKFHTLMDSADKFCIFWAIPHPCLDFQEIQFVGWKWKAKQSKYGVAWGRQRGCGYGFRYLNPFSEARESGS